METWRPAQIFSNLKGSILLGICERLLVISDAHVQPSFTAKLDKRKTLMSKCFAGDTTWDFFAMKILYDVILPFLVSTGFGVSQRPGFIGRSYRAGVYLFKVNSGNTRRKCEICSKLTIINHQNDVNDVILLSLLLTLSKFDTLFCSALQLWHWKWQFPPATVLSFTDKVSNVALFKVVMIWPKKMLLDFFSFNRVFTFFGESRRSYQDVLLDKIEHSYLFYCSNLIAAISFPVLTGILSEPKKILQFRHQS